MKKILLFLVLVITAVSSVNATTYYWVGGTAGTNTMIDRVNWSTVGVGGAVVGTAGTNITFAITDVMIIDGSDISSVAGIQTGAMNVTVWGTGTSISVGQFVVRNSANYVITAGSTRALNVGGSIAGDDLDIGSGSYFGFRGSTCSVVLAASNTGLIAGTIELGASGTSNASFMTITTTGSLTVANGGTWVHAGTGAVSANIDKAVFQTGSNMVFKGSSACNSSVAISGKTFYNVYLESSSGAWSPSISGATACTINGSMFIGGSGAGTLTTGATLTSNFAINGDVTIKSGCTLAWAGSYSVKGTWTNNGTFTHATGKTVTFNGTTIQTVTKSGGEAFKALTISNTSGNAVVLANGATVTNLTTVDANATLATAGTLTATGGATINGKFQINQGGFATGTFSYAATGSTLAWNLSNGSGTYYGPISGHSYWPTINPPFNVSVTNSTSGGGVDIDNITRTIVGTFTLAGKIINNCNLSFTGSLTLASNYEWGSSCGTFTYSCPSANALTYSSGGTVTRGPEWTSGLSPSNVVLGNNTTMNGPTAGAANICGDLTINTGSSLYMDYSGGSAALNVSGNFVMAGNLSLGSSVGGDMTVGGNWTHTTGTFNSNSRLVTFNGASGNQTITNAGGETFAYLTINKASGNVVLAGNVTVNNTLTLTTGNLSIAANTLTLNGAVSRTSGNFAGSDNSNLTIAGTAGSLFFDAAGTNNYLKDFTINASSSATLGNALNITGGAAAASEGTLTVTGSGVLTTGGFLTIRSNINGTGRIAANTSGGTYISGNVSVERYIRQNSSKGWRLLGTNTTGQTINAAWQEGQNNAMSNPNPGFGTKIAAGNSITTNLATAQAAGFDTLSAGVSLFSYNATTDALVTVTNTNATSLASEHGYYIFIRGDRSPGQFGAGAPTTATTLRSTGALFLGNQTAVSTGASNWGLVRNPYASRIDMRQIVRTGLLNDAYQVWDPKIGGAFGVGGFQTFFKSGADYLVSPGGGSYGSNGSVQNFIESGAAFFIQSTGGAGSAQVVEACKTSASSNASFRPVAGSPKLTYNVYANNGGSIDMVDGGLVFFDNVFSNGVDLDDVRKSTNFNENFGIVRNNVDLAIEKRQLINTDDTVFFKINQMRTISYRMDVAITDIDPLITTAVLEDKYTNVNTPMDLSGAINAYTFTIDATAASKAADRFRIVFKQSTVVPVSFISIKAAQTGNNIAVEWKVASQVNVVHYEIEKSANGRSFSNVGTINAGSGSTYNWLDENTVSGNNYYRIKSVDNNGQVKYSEVVKVNIGKGSGAITVSPNPVQSGYMNLQFNNQPAGEYAVRLINNAGQVVYNRTVQHTGGSASQSFALPSALVSGVYQLSVTAPDSSRQVQKLIVNTRN
ncbi:MAG: T9SS type A sorting domain-containing protein [Chitinophagaceae bacterium]|nr:T9SS type A sorting domain-containing protein [Chitinophagaceae bacterium]